MNDFSSRPISEFLLNDSGDLNNNKSFNSLLSATSLASNGSSSSKAVLAALRALQDKIRRLESERSLALDEVSQLKMQLKNQEVEFEHQKQKDQLASQKSLQDARSVNDKLLHDKTELEVKLSIIEEKNHQVLRQVEEYQLKTKHLEEEKHNSLARLKELEYEQLHLDQEIKHSQAKEKGIYIALFLCLCLFFIVEMAQSLVWETKRYEEDVEGLQEKIDALQKSIVDCSHEKTSLDMKLFELDQLVGQLLTLNKTLVSQLSGKPSKTELLSSSNKKVSVKKKSKTSAVNSVVTNDLSKAAKSVAAAAKRSILIKTPDDVEHLKLMHKMYADMAKSITRSMSPQSRSLSSESKMRAKISKSPVSSGNSEFESSAASSRTRMSGKKFRSHSPQVSSTDFRKTQSNDSHNIVLPRPATAIESKSSAVQSPNFSRTNLSNHLSNDYNNYLTDNTNKSDLQQMITSLEDEFDSLNKQYRSLLSSVQASSSVVPPSTSPEAIQAQAEEIVSVIQKLHHKGEQLRVLKSPLK